MKDNDQNDFKIFIKKRIRHDVLSIDKNLRITISRNFLQGLEGFSFVDLYSNNAMDTIAIVFKNKESDCSYKITKTPCGTGVITCQSILNHCNYKSDKPFTPKFDWDINTKTLKIYLQKPKEK